MSELLPNFELYILNEVNMQNYLKYKLEDSYESKKPLKIENKKSATNSSIFIPREQDSIFWCYYIITNSDIDYEMIQKRNTVISRQLKINLVSKIRENKHIVKAYKFDTITHIESNLANDNLLNMKTFMTLCAIDNINIVFVGKNIYYELLLNDINDIYIIREFDNSKLKYNKQYGYELATQELLNDIRNKYYKIDSLDKPIKAVSFYKVSDLLNIANRLAIETVNKDTGKNKTKNELYESIIQYF